MLAISGLAACSSLPEPDPAVPEVTSFHSPSGEQALAAGERIKIIVFGADNLSGNYRLGDNGNLDLPGLGQVHAGGLTALQLEEVIARNLAEKGMPDARVSVMRDAG